MRRCDWLGVLCTGIFLVFLLVALLDALTWALAPLR